MHRVTNLRLKPIRTSDTYVVRHPVLRNGLPIESCVFDRDDDSNTLHLGAYMGEKLVGVLTLLPNKANVQLRGMAVLHEMQKKGIGYQLILEAENRIKNMRISLLWLNARLLAVPFYERFGYQKQGEMFNLYHGGNHYKMTKKLCV
ncbi:MAG: GNAT family N-acetyltransferase [Bacteroidetes bacterium]|nr:GNAT family N-acetyltransferase [Bacteroidota bacterium]